MSKLTDKKRIPRHIAIIMDGNGRWAEGQSLPRAKGHIEGVRRVEEIIDTARKLGVKIVTLFTFSTENWNRPESEVSMIMSILSAVLEKKIQKLKQDNIQLRMIGRTDRIPQPLLKTINDVIRMTRENTGLIVNLAFNYGSRLEIVDAVQKISKSVQRGELAVEDINEQTVSDALYTKGLPDPDLLIRTSGEQRISNFLLWQLSYAEFYFTDKLWPDFDAKELKKAITEYQSRERRFGALITKEAVHE
ncbi:MAG: di-trans,poly-cis-decaprenylcistransferase [Omnitrophica WOR_2 bacterium RIFCSPHIGHO2_02_FULL_52_10]|nr:MAG: di-trans,poly-cis-decaprenylcistransferase [Omnitrophica WOR_2 bacterium RIFCSPHIGHO2_02_FULL_52_10]